MRNSSSSREGCGSISSSPVRKATAWARLAMGMISMPSTTAASAALAVGTSMPAQAVLLGGGHGHREGAAWPAGWCRRGPVRRRRHIRPAARQAICPLPARMPRAMGRSNEAASLGRSAGARLMTTRFCGRWKPELTIARSTRCVLSLTAASGRPTSMVFGRPAGETSTSTSTGKASMPSSEKVLSLASMCPSAVGCVKRTAKVLRELLAPGYCRKSCRGAGVPALAGGALRAAKAGTPTPLLWQPRAVSASRRAAAVYYCDNCGD